jgi:hypothetical protein
MAGRMPRRPGIFSLTIKHRRIGGFVIAQAILDGGLIQYEQHGALFLFVTRRLPSRNNITRFLSSGNIG